MGGPATGCTIDAESSEVARLEMIFPAAQPFLRAEGEVVRRSREHFVLRPAVARTSASPLAPVSARSSRWRTTVRDSQVDVRLEDGDVTLELAAGGRRVRVRRDAPGVDASLDGERLVLQRDGEVDAVYVPLERGVEELVMLSHERSVDYRFDLPAGWTLEVAEGYSGLVELRDSTNVAQARMRATTAWNAAGDQVPVRVRVAASSVRVSVASDVPGPVLLDPEWEDAGTVVQVRRNATTTLLANGQVLITGGAGAAGLVALDTTELYDPATGTFTAGPPMRAEPGIPEPRVHHAAVSLPNGRVLIAGGLAEELPLLEADEPASSVSPPALSSALLYDTALNAFSPAESMSDARARFAATLLQDGRVLVTGGTSSGQTHDSAEVFDPSTGQFDDVEPMDLPRHEHAATLLRDGRVLVTFGSDGEASIGSATLFDPNQGDTFGAELPGPALAARFGHLSVLLPDGRVLLAGGRDPALEPNPTTRADALLFDPADSSLSPTGSMNVSRFRSGAAVLPSGDVVIAGGLTDAHELIQLPIESAERFRWETGQFEALPDAPFKTQSPALHMMPEGSVFLSGLTPSGQLLDVLELEVAHPAVASWDDALGADAIGARAQATATLLESGDVLIAGGTDDLAAADDELPSQTLLYHPAYDATSPAEGIFEAWKYLHHPRALHTATRLVDGRVLFVGGGLQNIMLSSVEAYDPAREAFIDLGDTATVHGAGHTATTLPDGRVLIVGGLGTPSAAVASAEVFDPATDTFTAVGNMAQARAFHTASFLADGRILIGGGTISFLDPVFLATTEIYDPKTGQFSSGPEMGEGRAFHVAAELSDGRVLIAGGSPSGSTEVLAPTGDSFSFAEPTTPRTDATLTRLPTGRLLLAGGHAGLGAHSEISLLEIFNPATLSWSSLLDDGGLPLGLQARRRYHGATILADGRVLIAGGAVIESATPAYEAHELDTVEIIGEGVLPSALVSSIPQIGEAPLLALPDQVYPIEATSLTGFGDPGGGSFGGGGRPPIALWLPAQGPPELGTFLSWTSTGAEWLVPPARYPGPGLLFAVTNGVRSKGVVVRIPPAQQGVACTTGGQCESGYCADGVCCDQACGASPSPDAPFASACVACSAAKKGHGEDGVCEAVSAGTDPDMECEPRLECPAETGSCNGVGACQDCAVPPICDGESTIIAAEDVSCAPYKCSTETDQCLVACASSDDCAAPFVCTAQGVCASPFANDPLDSGCALVDRARGDHSSGWMTPAGLTMLTMLAAWIRRHRRARQWSRECA